MPPVSDVRRIPAIAAFVYPSGYDTSPLLARVAHLLRLRGVALAGAIQHNDGAGAMSLELLPSGRRMIISLPRAAAGACKLDNCALADAASVMRQALDAGPQLAIFNKFGAQEASGRGLHAEFAAAVLSETPLLTAVSDSVLPRWTAFTGGADTRLDCTPEAALAWWDGL